MAKAGLHAILLAAGRGRRLEQASGGIPKCLLEVGGSTLLERHLRALAQHGLQRLSVVTGYRADLIDDALRAISPPLMVRRVFNSEFELGSARSLWCALDALRSPVDVLLMDADVLYAPAVLAPLTSSSRSGLLLDRGVSLSDTEAVKVCVRDDEIVEFSKHPVLSIRPDYVAESVGFFRFTADMVRRIANHLSLRQLQSGLDFPHENVLRSVMLEEPSSFALHDVTGTPWIEIDFPSDVRRAREEILPRLQRARAPETGPVIA